MDMEELLAKIGENGIAIVAKPRKVLIRGDEVIDIEDIIDPIDVRPSDSLTEDEQIKLFEKMWD